MKLKKYRTEVVAAVLDVRESVLVGFFSKGGRGRKGLPQEKVGEGLDIEQISRFVKSDTYRRRKFDIGGDGQYEELESVLLTLGVIER